MYSNRSRHAPSRVSLFLQYFSTISAAPIFHALFRLFSLDIATPLPPCSPNDAWRPSITARLYRSCLPSPCSAILASPACPPRVLPSWPRRRSAQLSHCVQRPLEDLLNRQLDPIRSLIMVHPARRLATGECGIHQQPVVIDPVSAVEPRRLHAKMC